MSQTELPFGLGAEGVAIAGTAVMGIVNVTPDSFFDGGYLFRDGRACLSAVLRKAEAMVAQGADILDVGGESTRPGAQPVGLQQEIDRVVPIVEAIASQLGSVVSVDTSKGAVMVEAAKAGADMINDVRALRLPGALHAAQTTGLPVCLMHMQGDPVGMQTDPLYDNVREDVRSFLLARADECAEAGIERSRIMIDPGFGFGKTLSHNLQLMRGLTELANTGYPLVVGVSRKSMIGAVTGKPLAERLPGSLALAAMAVMQGAAVLRVHDVAETRDVVKMIDAVLKEE